MIEEIEETTTVSVIATGGRIDRVRGTGTGVHLGTGRGRLIDEIGTVAAVGGGEDEVAMIGMGGGKLMKKEIGGGGMSLKTGIIATDTAKTIAIQEV